MFMRNRYNILFSLFWASLVLVGIETQAQENLKFAPNDIPVPWYSQKITGCPYTHCSLASSLMVFDYFKGMTAEAQRTSSDAEKKLIEYQRNYFFKKRAPFRRRTSIGQGGYYSFEIDSLTRYYENMITERLPDTERLYRPWDSRVDKRKVYRSNSRTSSRTTRTLDRIAWH